MRSQDATSQNDPYEQHTKIFMSTAEAICDSVPPPWEAATAPPGTGSDSMSESSSEEALAFDDAAADLAALILAMISFSSGILQTTRISPSV